MTAWIQVVGMGDDGLEGLSPKMRTIIDAADVLVGGARHLEHVPHPTAHRIPWEKGITETFEQIEGHRGKNVVVIASGDPLHYGGAATMLRHFTTDDVATHPHPSSMSLAAARMGWPLQNLQCVSIHGRPLTTLNRWVFPGVRLLVLSRDGKSPREVAELMTQRGYGDSKITVLSHLGGSGEAVYEATAETLSGTFPDLNILAVDCIAGPDAIVLPVSGGLPDSAFDSDGMLTKREVRAVTLSSLAPLPGQVLWDVGAGSGSVSIEWMRSHPDCQAIAIEQDKERMARLLRNADHFGVPGLEVIEGQAPEALNDLPQPDAIFIGGGLSHVGVLELCWNALKPGGKLVANSVTLESEKVLLGFQDKFGGSFSQIAISRETSVGRLTTLKPMAPVVHYCVEKGAQDGSVF